MPFMRHSGRVLRPPGPAFPAGLMPDLWGFGSSPDLAPRLPPGGREVAPAKSAVRRELREPFAALFRLIGRLLG
jgi:hypothetical protein